MKTQIIKLRGQQGDVMLRRLDSMPMGTARTIAQRRCVLAHGESGHSHVVEQNDAELIEIGGRMLLSIQSPATVEHEEHKPQTLEAGIWEIGRVREKDWFRDMVGPVMD
jgi:hypothetical protein